MRKLLKVSLTVLLTIASTQVHAQAQTTNATSPKAEQTGAARYSVSTANVGTLLDDPYSRAVLAKYLPKIIGMSDEVGRSMTLKDMQTYAPDKLPEATLNKIDADLAKLPGAPNAAAPQGR